MGFYSQSIIVLNLIECWLNNELNDDYKKELYYKKEDE